MIKRCPEGFVWFSFHLPASRFCVTDGHCCCFRSFVCCCCITTPTAAFVVMKLINSQFSFGFLCFLWHCIEFPERVNETDPVEPVTCQPWSSRASKMTQPNLDYMGMFTLWISYASLFSFFLSSSPFFLHFIELRSNIIAHYFLTDD